METKETQQYNMDFFKENVNRKLVVTYDSPVRYYGMKKRSEVVRLKVVENGNSGQFMFRVGNARRKGYYLTQLTEMADILSVEVLPEEAPQTPEEVANKCRKVWEKMVKRLHPNLWPELREEKEKAKTEPGYEYTPDMYYSGRFKNISDVFKRWERESELKKLQEALDNKLDYLYINYSKDGVRGRDRRIRVEKAADGTLRAWYSSEYPGCGNGDYWLLINGTTAIFGEKD